MSQYKSSELRVSSAPQLLQVQHVVVLDFL